MLNWAYFPRSSKATDHAVRIVEVFRQHYDSVRSDRHQLESNEVLARIADGLSALGFRVEAGKRRAQKVHVPVLYGDNGSVRKAFDADAWDESECFVLEVEAGRGVINNQFLKDVFQACMMDGVRFLCIAVRNVYGPGKSRDFDRVVTFMDTLYASNRMSLPLEGILIVGY